ncbi:MAG: hypothetical protein ACI8XG_001327 [Congregibacter sp.]
MSFLFFFTLLSAPIAPLKVQSNIILSLGQ